MSRLCIVVVFACLAGFIAGCVAAESNSAPPYFYPVEHRGDLKALQEKAALHGYNLQIVRRDTESENDSESDAVEYDPPIPVSISSIIWALLPAPITTIATTVGKITSLIVKVAKVLMPVKPVLLGMGLVIGFCALTPYCTLVIEDPIASKIRAYKDYIPYVDDVEYYVNGAIDRVQALQK